MREALASTIYWFAVNIDQTAVALQTMPLWVVVYFGLVSVNLLVMGE